MEEFNSIIRLTKFPFNIKWRLTDCCNYNCSYCGRKNHDKSIDNLEEDIAIIYETLPEVIRIINEVKKDTRIGFIGGEISLLDLSYLIQQIYENTNGLLKGISITTNFSKPISYYNNLVKLCDDYNIYLSIIISYHPEYNEITNFFEKFMELNHGSNMDLKIEMVSTLTNKDLVLEFIDLCKNNNLTYMVDGDLNVKDSSLIISETSEKKKNAFRIDYDDHSEFCKSLSELCYNYGTDRKINSEGFYCTLDYDYVYIEKNQHIGFEGEDENCKYKEPLENFHILTEPKLCKKKCSLCGSMSIFKDIKYYNKN